MDIVEIRRLIDGVDKDILELLLYRLELSSRVAEYKIERELPILNATREEEILNNIAYNSGNMADYTCEVYRAIMSSSRRLQDVIIQNKDLDSKN